MAQLLNSNVTGNLTVSQNVTVNGVLTVGGNVIYSTINATYAAANASGNTVRVSSNSGSTLSNKQLNFINTSSVTVSVADGGDGNANISFVATGSAGAAYDQANLAYAAANAAANTVWVYANGTSVLTKANLNFNNTATVQVSATANGTGQANVAFTVNPAGADFAAGANSTAQSAYAQANTAYGQANAAYGQANAAYGQANLAYDQANTARSQANTAYGQANSAYGQANSAYAAANTSGNTVRVSANSGSTLANKQLNFVNSGTVTVAVTDAGDGNANITFTATAAEAPDATARSLANAAANTVAVFANGTVVLTKANVNFNNTATINVSATANGTDQVNVAFSVNSSAVGGVTQFPVSSNGGSTVTANAINFVNTTSASVTVAAGVNGNANVSIQSSNLFYSGMQTSQNTTFVTTKRVSEWFHGRSSNVYSLPAGAGTPQGIYVKPDGTSIYVVDNTPELVYQINLAQAWNLATAANNTSFNISAQETLATDVSFKTDGTTMYILGDSGNDITYYTLGTAWDVTTAGTPGTASVSAQTGAPTGFFFKEDGTKLWVISATVVYAYTMSTPWVLSSGFTYDGVSYTPGVDSTLRSISFSPDGLTMHLMGDTNDLIYEFILSSAWDISTASYTGKKKSTRFREAITGISAESTPNGLYVGYQNNRMYLIGSQEDVILEYTLNEGVSVNTNEFYVAGRGHFDDDVIVFGDVVATESIQSFGTITGGTTNQFEVGTTGAITAPSISLSSSISTTVNASVSLGVGVGNTVVDLGIGATLASNTKNVRIGTGGTAGSNTYINMGPTDGNANVEIRANTTNVYGTLLVNNVNVLPTINAAANTVRVSANSDSTLSSKQLNFVNTATVTVAVTDSGDGNANITFTSTATGGDPAAAYAQANLAYDQANAAYGQANSAYTQANDAYTRANTANTQANAARDQANTAYGQANAAYGQANSAYAAANSAANLTSVSANTGSIIYDASINFNNSNSIIVSVTSGIGGNANVQFETTVVPGTVASAATITPVLTGASTHYTVTALATNPTINPPSGGTDGEKLTLRIKDNGSPRTLNWTTTAGGYRGVGVTLPTTTTASKVMYIGAIYNSQDNFWDVIAYVELA